MEKTLQTVQTISLRGSVIALDVQDTVKVPFGVRSASYVRHIAAMVGMEMDRRCIQTAKLRCMRSPGPAKFNPLNS